MCFKTVQEWGKLVDKTCTDNCFNWVMDTGACNSIVYFYWCLKFSVIKRLPRVKHDTAIKHWKEKRKAGEPAGQGSVLV